jgi:probable rRNA maturation factor
MRENGRLIDLRAETPEWDSLVDVLSACAQATLDQLQRGDCEVSILLTDDTNVRTLNSDWRNQDKPTNVLAFAAFGPEEIPPVSQPAALGDLVLAWGVCTREADEQGKTLADHARHLIVHGLLHLLGYDHLNDQDAQTMEALEIDLLARQGVPNPYGMTHG